MQLNGERLAYIWAFYLGNSTILELDQICHKVHQLAAWFGAMLENWLQWAPGDGRGSTSFATLEDLTDALNEAGLGASACDLKLKVTRT